MKRLNREELKDILITSNICFYDGIGIIEFDKETDTLDLVDMSEVKFDSIDFDFFVEYKIEEEYGFEDDIKEIIKDLNKCSKEYQKFESGNSCMVIVESEEKKVLNQDEIEELYSFENLQNKFESLMILKLKKL